MGVEEVVSPWEKLTGVEGSRQLPPRRLDGYKYAV